MIEAGELLRYATLFLLIGWRTYWHITEIQTEKDQPVKKEKLQVFHKKQLSKYVTYLIFGIAGVQLLGVRLLDLPQQFFQVQIIGFVLVIIGITVACLGRYALGTNWARCYDYQVKTNQQLVTHGVYKYIRHPLYCGIALFLIGTELVVQSWLIFPYLLLFIAADIQAKREEKLLKQHFGSRYTKYMRSTKRFIPFGW